MKILNFRAEVAERDDSSDSFGVEAFGSDGECYMAIFSGPGAESRAHEYKTAKFSDELVGETE